MIPVSGVGEAVSGVCEVEVEEKTGGNGAKGTPNNDMTDEGVILRRLTKTHHTLSHAECA